MTINKNDCLQFAFSLLNEARELTLRQDNPRLYDSTNAEIKAWWAQLAIAKAKTAEQYLKLAEMIKGE